MKTKIMLFGMKGQKFKLSIIEIDNYGNVEEILHGVGLSEEEFIVDITRQKEKIIELDINFFEIKQENGKRFSQTHEETISCKVMPLTTARKVVKTMKKINLQEV